MNAFPAGLSFAVIALVSFTSVVRAEEKNGVQLMVQKKTLDRNDTRGGYYYLDRIDRTQGLKVTVKNMTFKPQPEGEVEWTIVVRKYYSTLLEGFTGVEKLKALRPTDLEEMVMGAAQITGWAGYYDAAKDKIEYQVIVKQDGVEKVRVQSTAGFDALAKRAQIKKVKASDKDEKDEKGSTATRKSTPEPRATPAPRATPVPRATPGPVVRATPAPRATPKPAQLPAGEPLDGGAVK